MSRVLLTLALLAPALWAQHAEHAQTIEERTAGMQKLDGYFPLYWDERTGNLWLEIARFHDEFLFGDGRGGRAGLERHRARPRARRRGQAGVIRARRSAGDAGAGATSRSARRARIRRSGVGGQIRSPNRFFGVHRGGGEQRPRARGRYGFLPARWDGARPIAAARGTTASIARAARSTWTALKRSPRIPKLKLP